MRIGVYARGANVSMGGVKEYILNVTRELIQLKAPEDEIVVFVGKGSTFPRYENVRYIELTNKQRILADFLEAPRKINTESLDVVWFPKNVIPFGISNKVKKILTIHDLAYFRPEYNAYPLSDTVYMKFMIGSSVKRADVIIADSESTKNDINTFLKIPLDAIGVVHLGVDRTYTKITDSSALHTVITKYALPEKFILYTGNISPRKNLVRLIHAFKLIETQVPHSLVITGKKGWNNTNVLELIHSSDKVTQIGYVDTEDLPALYSMADVYAYPSLYEGFGLPILEAQACGCPVVTARNSSIPEVGRESVLYVDPYSEEDIANGLLKVLTDNKLRDTLVASGYENCIDFTWKNTAQNIHTYMKDIIARK